MSLSWAARTRGVPGERPENRFPEGKTDRNHNQFERLNLPALEAELLSERVKESERTDEMVVLRNVKDEGDCLFLGISLLLWLLQGIEITTRTLREEVKHEFKEGRDDDHRPPSYPID